MDAKIGFKHLPGGLAADGYMLNLRLVGGSEPTPKISVQCLFTTALGTAEIWWWITPFRSSRQHQIGDLTSLEWGFDSETRTTYDEVTLAPDQILSINFPIFIQGTAFPVRGIIRCALFRDIEGQLTNVANSADYPMFFEQKQDAIHV